MHSMDCKPLFEKNIHLSCICWKYIFKFKIVEVSSFDSILLYAAHVHQAL